MHCSTGQGKIVFPMFSAALQTRLTAGTVSLQLHLWRFALVIAIIPVVICCSHRRAATQEMHCHTGQGKIRSPLFSAALQNRLTAGLGHCSYLYRDLLFLQMSSDTTGMHYSTGQGKM